MGLPISSSDSHQQVHPGVCGLPLSSWTYYDAYGFLLCVDICSLQVTRGGCHTDRQVHVPQVRNCWRLLAGSVSLQPMSTAKVACLVQVVRCLPAGACSLWRFCSLVRCGSGMLRTST